MTKRVKWLLLGLLTVAFALGGAMAPLDRSAAQRTGGAVRIGSLPLSCFARRRIDDLDWTSGLELGGIAQLGIERCLDEDGLCDLGMIFDPVSLEETRGLRAFQRQLAELAAQLDRSRALRRRAVDGMGRWAVDCGLEGRLEGILDRVDAAIDAVEAEPEYLACRATCLPAEAERDVWAVAALPSVECYDDRCPGDTADPLVATIARRLAAGAYVGRPEGLTIAELRDHAARLRRAIAPADEGYRRFD